MKPSDDAPQGKDSWAVLGVGGVPVRRADFAALASSEELMCDFGTLEFTS